MHVGIAYLRWRGKRSRHSRRMRTRDFAYLARGPWLLILTLKTDSLDDAKFGGTVGCHDDNLPCHPRRKSWHHEPVSSISFLNDEARSLGRHTTISDRIEYNVDAVCETWSFTYPDMLRGYIGPCQYCYIDIFLSMDWVSHQVKRTASKSFFYSFHHK